MQQFFFWFSLCMAALFIGCGFVLLATGAFIDAVPPPNRTWLGIIFIVYGGFRGTMQYARYKRLKQEQQP